MKKRTSVCLVLTMVIFSGCGLSTPNDRQEETNKRLDQIHTDLQQLHRDLHKTP
jgi:peptidoglycan hydrolase CwlO-like protein